MSNPPYRALRIILGIFSLFTAAAGLLFILSGKPLVMRLFLRPPETEISTLLLFVMRELVGLGGASEVRRTPHRNGSRLWFAKAKAHSNRSSLLLCAGKFSAGKSLLGMKRTPCGMCTSHKYREHSEQSFFASLEQASVAHRMR